MIDAHARRAHAALVGRTVEILCDGPSKTNPRRLAGRTRANKIVVFESAEPERHVGQLVNVRIDESSGFTLYGTATDREPAGVAAAVFDTAGMPG